MIQACNPPDTLFLLGLFYKLLFGKKFIFDHHDICPELYLAKFGRKDFFYKLMLIFERLTFKTADLAIATNKSYESIAINRGKMDPSKVAVVRSGPSLERMKILPSNPEWKRGREYLIAYVGVMGQQEGINHLLEAARILIIERGRDDIQFVLVGSGTEFDSLRSRSRQMGLTDFVKFTGRIPDEPMLEVLSTADICVNPDLANEMNDKSTMNKIMEYMALGKPIVQYDLTEGKFSAQKTSLYAEKNNAADIADKITYLLDRPGLRKEMGEFGRKRVMEELHWGVEAPKYLGVYEKLNRLIKNNRHK